MAATSRLRDLGAFGLLFFKVVLFFNVAGQGRGGPSPASRQRVLPSPTPAAKGNGKFSQSGLKKKKKCKKNPKKTQPRTRSALDEAARGGPSPARRGHVLPAGGAGEGGGGASPLFVARSARAPAAHGRLPTSFEERSTARAYPPAT